jgi:hypothetical protein
MDKYGPKLAVAVMSTSSAFLLSSQAPSTQKVHYRLLMSAISEPEDGLIRSFYIETNDKSYINSLVIKDSHGNSVTYRVETLQSTEVTIAKVKGLDAVLMQLLAVTGDEGLIKVRYLSRAPSDYRTFELRIKKDSEGRWAMYEKDRPRKFEWMLFRSRNFMGITVGVDSYELSLEKPKL